MAYWKEQKAWKCKQISGGPHANPPLPPFYLACSLHFTATIKIISEHNVYMRVDIYYHIESESMP